MITQIANFLFMIAVLALLWGGVVDGAMVEVSLTASKDARISRDIEVDYPGPQANGNFGAEGKIGTTTRGSGETVRALIGFDSSSFEDIGAANVVSAELNLKIFSGEWPWDKKLVQLNEVRRLTHDWVEGTGAAPGTPKWHDPEYTGGTKDGVNWLTYDGVNPWPGGPGARGDTGDTVIGTQIPYTKEYRVGRGESRPASLLPKDVFVDVTELIKEAANPAVPFYGFFFEAVANPEVSNFEDPDGEFSRWGTRNPGGPGPSEYYDLDPHPSVLNLVLVPEPATVLVVGIGAFGLLARKSR